MECPKCRKEISEDCAICPFCKTKIKDMPEKKRKKSVFILKKSAKGEKPPKKSATENSDGKGLRSNSLKFASTFKAVIAVVCALAVIIIAAVIISAVISSKGEKYGEKISQYIGRDVSSLKSEEEIYLKDESAFFGVNSAVSFDYVFESDGKLTTNDITYPEWAVFVDVSDINFITDVTYTDFTVIKKDMRGVKHKELVSLDSFNEGAKQSAVLKAVDMKPYSISYSQKGIVVYTYKYYYIRDNGDAQQVILRAVFTEDGEYEYSSTELIYPDNL